MRRLISTLWVPSCCVVLLLLSGCNVTMIPRDGLERLRPQIKTVGLVAIAEPEYDNLSRSRSSFTRELVEDVAGPIGSVIYTARDGEKTRKDKEALAQALRPFNPNVADTLLERMAQNLRSRGYTVKYVRKPALLPDGRYDLSSPEFEGIDAFVELLVAAGYAPNAKQDVHLPFVRVGEAVFDAQGKPVFLRAEGSGDAGTGRSAPIVVPAKYSLRNEQAVIDNPALVLEAFYDSVGQLADLLAKDF